MRSETTTKAGPYLWRLWPEHPKANSLGYVQEHYLVAEAALGKPLPTEAVVHHVNGDGHDNRNRNLVVCENQGYHRLLHARLRVLRRGGWPGLDRICRPCDRVLPLEAFSSGNNGTLDGYCRECRAHRAAQRRK